MNTTLFYFLYSSAHRSEGLDSLIRFVAVDLIYIMVLVTGIFIIVRYKLYDLRAAISRVRKQWKTIIAIPFAAFLARIIAEILKDTIHTLRPFIALPDVHSLFYESGYAFPSGHSTIISALAFAIYYKNKPLGIAFMVAALLIGVARVVSGVHFPIDIIGGYALGFLVAFFTKTL